jgi:MFS family permease
MGGSDFLKLWLGSTLSRLGGEVSGVAVPLAAIALGAGPLHMALLRSAGSIWNLALGPVAGAMADRVSWRPIVLGADLGRAALIGSVPLAALAGVLALPQLLGVAVAVGALSTVARAAQGPMLVGVVGRARLGEANSRLAASRQATHVVGPSLGGALVQLLTAPIALAIDALSFLLSGLTWLAIRAPARPPARSAPAAGIWREAAAGMHFVLAHPTLRRLIIGTAAFELFDAAFFAQYVLYVTDHLGVTPAALGAVYTIGAVGGVFGAAAAAWAARRFGRGRALVGGLLLAGIGDALIPWAGLNPALALPVLAAAELLVALGVALFGVNQETLSQEVTPDGMLGRTGAAGLVLGSAATLVGSFGGALVAGLVGLPTLLAVSATATLGAGLWLLRSPVWGLGRPG